MIKERISQLIEYKGIGKEEFYSKIGMTSSNFRGAARKTPINSTAIANIIALIPDVNIYWLLTGQGDMLLDNQVQELYHPKQPDPIQEEQEVPLYDISATAGFLEILENKTEHVIDTIKIPNVSKCDGAIAIVGDSMYPLLKSGDIVLYKEVHDLNCIFYGEMYLMALEMDNDEFVTVKYVQRSDIDDAHFKLVSYNPHHSPKEVLKESIRAIALVKASIRYHSLL